MELVIALLAIGVTVAIILYLTRDVYDDKSPLEEYLVGKKESVEVSDVKVTKKPKLPTKPKLLEMTKAQIEEVGREFGIELDKRKTKDNMIEQLKTEFKAAQKVSK